MNPAPRAVVPLLLLPPLFALWPGAFCSTPSAEYTAVRLAAASLGAMLRQRLEHSAVPEIRSKSYEKQVK